LGQADQSGRGFRSFLGGGGGRRHDQDNAEVEFNEVCALTDCCDLFECESPLTLDEQGPELVLPSSEGLPGGFRVTHNIPCLIGHLDGAFSRLSRGEKDLELLEVL